MEIPHVVFEKFIKWTKPPMNSNTLLDKRFVSVLLLALTDDSELLEDNIPTDVMNFVEGMSNISYFTFGNLLK